MPGHHQRQQLDTENTTIKSARIRKPRPDKSSGSATHQDGTKRDFADGYCVTISVSTFPVATKRDVAVTMTCQPRGAAYHPSAWCAYVRATMTLQNDSGGKSALHEARQPAITYQTRLAALGIGRQGAGRVRLHRNRSPGSET